MLSKRLRRALALGQYLLPLVAIGSRSLAGIMVPVESSPTPDVWRSLRKDFDAATANNQLDAKISQLLTQFLKQGHSYNDTIRWSYGLVARDNWSKLDEFWLGRPDVKTDVDLFRVFMEARAIGTGAFMLDQQELLEKWVHKASAGDPYDGDGNNGHGNDPDGHDNSNPGKNPGRGA